MGKESQNIELKVETKEWFELTPYEKEIIAQINKNMDMANDLTWDAWTKTGSTEIAYLEKIWIVNSDWKLDMNKLMDVPNGNEQRVYKVALQNMTWKLKSIKIEWTEKINYQNPLVRQMFKDGVLEGWLKASFKDPNNPTVKQENGKIILSFIGNWYKWDIDITQMTLSGLSKVLEEQAWPQVLNTSKPSFVTIKNYKLPLPYTTWYWSNTMESQLDFVDTKETGTTKVNQINELLSYEQLFALGSSQINMSDPYVQKMLAVIKKNIHVLDGKTITLTWYVDRTTNALWDNNLKNNTLDLNRANAVKDLLVKECWLKQEQIITTWWWITDQFTVWWNTSYNRRVVMSIN